jgi:hypothetical protein
MEGTLGVNNDFARANLPVIEAHQPWSHTSVDRVALDPSPLPSPGGLCMTHISSPLALTEVVQYPFLAWRGKGGMGGRGAVLTPTRTLPPQGGGERFAGAAHDIPTLVSPHRGEGARGLIGQSSAEHYWGRVKVGEEGRRESDAEGKR